jgi:hypothetical protein
VTGAACVLLLGTLGASPGTAQAPPQEERSIQTEFRVFDGTTEVSDATRLRVRRSGREEAGQALEGPALTIHLEPGLYDVQAIRHRQGQVQAVRWAERLVIVHYPDEAGRHLEVIHLAPGYGALQLRTPGTPRPDPQALRIERSTAGEPGRTSTVTSGDGYLLVIGRAGVYDVRVTLRGEAPQALSSIEIPADRTRMRVLASTARQP